MRSFIGKFLSAIVLVGAFSLNAQADRTSISLSRSAGSNLELTGQLSKDVYRYVDRVEEYSVQVPYYVQVPYTDYEVYYEQEYVCRWVEKPGYNDCHYKTVCTYPGGNPKDKVCHQEKVCTWIPGKREQVCNYESVRRERPVTKYRTETRYRTEYRTRVVTDSIYDHSWGTEVLVVFPRGSELLAGESEQVSVTLGGYEGNPDASVSVSSSVFSYSVSNKYKNGNQIVFELAHSPRYSAYDLGNGTVTGIQIVKKSYLNYALEFRDSGLKGRTATKYHIEITDMVTRALEYSGDVSSMNSGYVSVPMPANVKSDRDYTVIVQVNRSGVSIAGGSVQFTAQINVTGQLDAAPYSDASALKNFKITGANDTAQIEFVDGSPVNAEVDSTYEITVLRNVTYRDEIARGTYSRASLATQPDGRMLILMKDMPGMAQSAVNDHLDSGDGIKLEITVRRTSARLKEVSPIQFQTSATVKVGK